MSETGRGACAAFFTPRVSFILETHLRQGAGGDPLCRPIKYLCTACAIVVSSREEHFLFWLTNVAANVGSCGREDGVDTSSMTF